MEKYIAWPAPVPGWPSAALRRAAATILRRAGRGLDRLGRRLAVGAPAAPAAADPVLEFYAEAGAPEGALYVDGRRVGVLPGVTRL
jgi:hypothetical protein